MAAAWHPSSWREKPIKQQVVYEDQKALEQSLAKLRTLPPLVSSAEIVRLRESLRDVALGDAFLLQGGDCAELFSYCESGSIDAKMKLLLQMSLVMIWGAKKRVVRIARMAGQYAKPRSSPMEKVDGKEIPSFRGDILNGYPLEQREIDPRRLLDAYFHSASSLNYLRSQLSSGFADLSHSFDWDLGNVKDESVAKEYRQIASYLTESLDFMRVIGADRSTELNTVDLYTSHEGLVLEYEECLTRKLKHPRPRPSDRSIEDSQAPAASDEGWYDTSAHFLWIGDRTRQLDGGHVEFFRGLENPIGIKVGPTMKNDELIELLNIVNPLKEVGKVTLITRYGEKKIDEMLGDHIEAVKKSGHVVVWQCDPMHGNTITTSEGIKTRQFSSIFAEVYSARRIHKLHNSNLGGLHLELTGDAVTECIGGSGGLVEEDLSLNYTTYCDPRLNERQALELALLVAGHDRRYKNQPQENGA